MKYTEKICQPHEIIVTANTMDADGYLLHSALPVKGDNAYQLIFVKKD